MKNPIREFRFVAVVGTLFIFVASISTFVWGSIRTVKLVQVLLVDFDRFTAVSAIEVLDSFLIASTLLLFGFGLYDLFIGGLGLPAALTIRDFHELKSRLSGVLILLMVVFFIEHFVQWKTGEDILRQAAALFLVAVALIAFNRFGDTEKQ
ncbi:MAG: YqhA family protein [Acidobacteria bacterium]|nr:YqhA family protein [Acidobacteriota bacterium]